jgi:hypothetical protein
VQHHIKKAPLSRAWFYRVVLLKHNIKMGTEMFGYTMFGSGMLIGAFGAAFAKWVIDEFRARRQNQKSKF